MYVVKIAFVFVFLFSFSSAQLPDVFGCGFKEYYCNIRKCTTVFYKDLQKDPTAANCGVLHYITFACIRKVFNGCVNNALNQTEAAAQLARSVNEKVFCIDGPFEILANPRRIVPFVSLTCNKAYDQGVTVCGKTLQQTFVANRADTSLCSEYTKTKKCVKDLLMSECTFRSQDAGVFEFLFDDYNPFCENNRDTGATGSAQCDDFPPEPTPTVIPCNEGAVISGAKQFILFLLLAMYFALI